MKTAAEKLRMLAKYPTYWTDEKSRLSPFMPGAFEEIAQLLERANTYRVPESWERDYIRLGQMLPEVE